MRTALIVIGLAVVLAILGTVFRESLFPGAEPTAQKPASAPPTTAVPTASVESQAEAFIAKLAKTQSEPLPAKNADHFVLKDQIISLLPESTIELTTPEGIERNPALKPDTPITVIREAEQVEATTPEKIIAEAGGDLNKTVKVLDGEQVREMTVREVLQRYADHPDDPISVVKTVQYFEITTPAEIARDSSLAPDQELKIITKPYRLEAATIAELLMREGKFDPDSIFYVRTIRDTDDQGIWGIIHDGIMTNFAQGMAIRRGKEVDTYKIDIPRDADELLTDQSSSFLGKLIYRKAAESHVYNFTKNRMGQNPDQILPGQEIVIINFAPDELIGIYKHFVAEQG
ncbi:MAG: hypothetical protein QNL90_03735 [Gammaproteobacteria bacterium]|nr:hypothetical protein [Gammaproteobacteria bacterium]MDX2459216.1 hypothetical protein [Gammaproteobacteria bacterium]